MKHLSTTLFRAPALFLSTASALCLSMMASAQTQPTVAQPPVTAAQPLLLDRAHVLEIHGQIDLAVQTWKQILLVAPNNPQALRGLARAARSNGDEALANTYLARLPANAGRPKGLLPDGGANLHADHAAELKQGVRDSAMADGQRPEAARTAPAESAQTARSNAKGRPPSSKVEAKSVLVVSDGESADGDRMDTRSTDQKSLHAAEGRYRAALATRPSSPEALEGLGDTLLKERQPAAAIAPFARLVKLRASEAPAWRGLFLSELRAGDAVRALRTERLIPAPQRADLAKDPIFLCGLATAYTAVGRETEATEVLHHALELPFGVGEQSAETAARLQYAGLLQTGNHLDEAADLYRQVLIKEPEDTSAWRGLVRAEHAMNQDKKAMQTLESMSAASYADAIQEPMFAATAASLYRSQRRVELESIASAGPTQAAPLAVQPVVGLGTLRGVRRPATVAAAQPAVAEAPHHVPEKEASVAGHRSTPAGMVGAGVKQGELSVVSPAASSARPETPAISPAESHGSAHATKAAAPVVSPVAPEPQRAAAAVASTGSASSPALPAKGAAKPSTPPAEEVYGAFVPYKPPVAVPPAAVTPPIQKAVPPPEEMESVPILNLVPTAALVLNTSWLPNLSPPHRLAPVQLSSLLPLSGESKPPVEDYSTPALESGATPQPVVADRPSGSF